ncbi:MAG: DNA translocase FtsK 4TM domain-containing protein [Clostridia bacterium]|nr:DNA translocase FtsK 4TM domain-containing protein [Clostridia bacterium]
MANRKTAASRTRASSGRKNVPARSGSKNKAQDYEPRRDSMCIIFWGIAVLMLIATFFRPDEYSLMYSVHQTVLGLTGYMTWSVPIAFGFAGYLAYRSNTDERPLRKVIFLVFALEILLLTAVEVFHCQAISKSMNYTGYFNFLSYAYRAHTGGGLFGALIAWPLYSMLSEIGAIIAIVILVLLSLISMRAFSLSAIGNRISSKIGDMKALRANNTEDEVRPAPKSAAKRANANTPSTRVPPRTSAPRRTSAASADPFIVKTAVPNRKRNGERLYIEQLDDDYVDASAPIRLPKLKKSGRQVTPVSNASKDFEIPEVSPQSNDIYYTEKPASTRKTGKKPTKKTAQPKEEAPVIEKIDLMCAVREEDSNTRNENYVKNALKNHDRKPKPVLTYSLENTRYANNTEEDDDDDGIEITPAPAVRLPERKPVKTEKAEPAASKIEKPAPAAVQPPKPVRPAEKPVSKEAEAPKPAGQMPKPSFFDDTIEANTKEEDPKGPAPFKPTSGITDSKQPDEYVFPTLDLMEAGEEIQKSESGYDPQDMQRAETLVKTLQSFSIPVKITGISHGPAVTRFELLPAPGIKVSRIASYADDIAMNLAAVSVRIEAPIPGKSAVGVELPNVKKETVHLRNVLESKEARKESSRLAMGLGKDNSGKYIVADLASMPHVLIAGQTGSGKSVCINAIIISILYRATPDEVRMILIDPKMVELNAYNTIPHLLVPVVTDPKKAASVLEWAVSEMTRRYKEFAAHGAKNIQSYNKKLPPEEKKMPQIVLIVDELADLMMTSPRDVEEAINRLAQLARAAGIHLVIATQRPSVDIITGVIKANIPTRIAFTVASGVDSRTILDSYGAEKLLGKGDMLYLPPDRNKPLRVQGAWVSEAEVQAVVDAISETDGSNFDEDILEHMENAVLSDAEKNDKAHDEEENTVDELFEVAVKCVVDAGQASISMLQRKLRVGYARAGRLIDEMAARGIVSQSEGSKSREVLITREQFNDMFENGSINSDI